MDVGRWIKRPTTINSTSDFGGVDEADRGGVERGLGTGLNAQLGQYAADVALDCPVANRQLLRDPVKRFLQLNRDVWLSIEIEIELDLDVPAVTPLSAAAQPQASPLWTQKGLPSGR